MSALRRRMSSAEAARQIHKSAQTLCRMYQQENVTGTVYVGMEHGGLPIAQGIIVAL